MHLAGHVFRTLLFGEKIKISNQSVRIKNHNKLLFLFAFNDEALYPIYDCTLLQMNSLSVFDNDYSIDSQQLLTIARPAGANPIKEI